jgi:carboxymethylenebutenolidase
MADDMKLETSQAKSLVPPTDATRRGLLGLSAGAGYALLVQPVSAATITTNTQGLTAGDIRIKAADREIGGYRAYPAGKTNLPTVVVIHEIFGVHEHIKDLCRRLAKAGYYAIAPDLYARYGDATKETDFQKLIRDIVGKTKTPEIKSDIDSALVFAKGEKADVARLGVTGFCWGGGQTWRYTAMNPAVKAACPFYGPLTADPKPSPVDLAAQMKGRVMGFYGGRDQGILPAQVEAMRAALKAAGDTKSQIVVYPNAPHGFVADYRDSYVEADAKDAWTKMLAWFKAHGVA